MSQMVLKQNKMLFSRKNELNFANSSSAAKLHHILWRDNTLTSVRKPC